MKTKLFPLVILLLVFTSCLNIASQAQNSYAVPEGWEKYEVPQACSFAVPPTLELRNDSSQYAVMLQAIKKASHWEISCEKCNVFSEKFSMVFQPKGLNDKNYENLSSYARILIQFRNNQESDFTEEEIRGASALDIQILSEAYKQNTLEQIECLKREKVAMNSLNVERWGGTSRLEINGAICLLTEYDRQGINGTTEVKTYEFYAGTNVIEFMISYNKNTGASFANDLSKVINTIKFDQQFLDGKVEIDQTVNQKKTFTSSLHNLEYEFDAKTLFPAIIESAPHMLMKLCSDNKSCTVSISAFSEQDLSGYAIDDIELLDFWKNVDKNNMGADPHCTLISSCVLHRINGVKMLRSEFILSYNGRQENFIIYRTLNHGELQVVSISLPAENSPEYSNFESELIRNYHQTN
jgi:hypothetical protein